MTGRQVSTNWLALAAKANGGKVIDTELLPEKAARAKPHIEEAGLGDVVELRVGDAKETLRDLSGEVDLLLNDGFPMLALEIVKLVGPRMRPGGVVLTDNVGTFKANYADYVAFMREPNNGFASTLLPYKSGISQALALAKVLTWGRHRRDPGAQEARRGEVRVTQADARRCSAGRRG